MEGMPNNQEARRWNPVRVTQVTVALLPVAIAIGGAAMRVVFPVAVVCAIGVVRRERLVSAPTKVQRRVLERMAKVPNAVQATLAAYTLIGFAAIYNFFHGGHRLAALFAQMVIVFAVSTWIRSVFNQETPPSENPESLIARAPDPATARSQPPPSLDQI
jgi:sterol desaturase/sphingolipid hydroxylase (fatty acid hydroxylase superfamily)